MKKIVASKKFFSVMLFVFVSTLIVFAQQNLIKGTVVDSSNEPIIGANVVVKGSVIGTVTGMNGEFALYGASPGSTLVVSHLGYVTQEVSLLGSNLKITLREDSGDLGDGGNDYWEAGYFYCRCKTDSNGNKKCYGGNAVSLRANCYKGLMGVDCSNYNVNCP